MSNIEAIFPDGEEWTPTQALANALSVADEMESVVVAYLIKDTGGETCIQMSNTDSKDLLWLGNAIKVYATRE